MVLSLLKASTFRLEWVFTIFFSSPFCMLSSTSLVFLFSSLIRRNKASICSAFFDSRFLLLGNSSGMKTLRVMVEADSLLESVEEIELERPESTAFLLLPPDFFGLSATWSSSVSLDIVEDTAPQSVSDSMLPLLDLFTKPLTTSLQPIRIDIERLERRLE